MPLIAASAAYQKTEERRRDKEQRKGRKGDEGKRKGFLAASRSRWRIQKKKKDSGLSAAEITMKEIKVNTDQTEKEKDTMKKHVITTFMKKHLMKTTALCTAAVIAAASSGMTANASGPLYTEGDGWFSGAKQDEAAQEAADGETYGWETMTYTWDVEDSAPADTSADAGASSADNTSYDNVSYDSGSASEVSYDSNSGESYDEAGSDYTDNSTMNSNTAASTQAAAGTSGVERKGNTVTVPGKETFRQKSSSANGTYTVIHMGQEKYTLQLKDAAGNNVGFKGVGMYKADDGRYFINVVPNDGADTAGWSVVTMKGDKAYLPKLGISGVALNGTVIVDVDAEAATK